MTVFSLTTRIGPVIPPRFKSFIIGTVSAIALYASVVQAEVLPIFRSGAWDTIAGTAENGKRMCGILVAGGDKVLVVKWFAGDPLLAVHLLKTSWNIPVGTHTQMEIRMDGGVSGGWSGNAEAFKTDMLELLIRSDEGGTFLERLAQANTLSISFPSGPEADWRVSVNGSRAAVSKMFECIGRTRKPEARPAQPFTSQARPPATPSFISPVRRPSATPVEAERQII
jgi:hypothetical protein